MAISTLCAKLVSGHDVSCAPPARKYYQQAVVINQTDIASFTVSTPNVDTGVCAYNVQFTLKTGTTGYLFKGSEAGSAFFGAYDKSRGDLGFPQYIHQVQVILTGAGEEQKCIIDALDKGSFVVAMQLKDGTVEIYGMGNGLSTGDYTYNLQEGGGGAPVILQSNEEAPEGRLPYVYKSAVANGETADFDSLFAA